MELHSEIESYRRVLAFRSPEGESSTVIVTRRKNTVWLTFNGARKTTIVMRDQEADQLVEAISDASRNLQ